jgi:hypothetical protein
VENLSLWRGCHFATGFLQMAMEWLHQGREIFLLKKTFFFFFCAVRFPFKNPVQHASKSSVSKQQLLVRWRVVF